MLNLLINTLIYGFVFSKTIILKINDDVDLNTWRDNFFIDNSHIKILNHTHKAIVETDEEVDLDDDIEGIYDDTTVTFDDFVSYTSACDADWGLDRINQGDLPLDQDYLTDDNIIGQERVDVFVIDTGLYKDHINFEDLTPVLLDVNGGNDYVDMEGHGSHVAGTVAGKKSGIAKYINLYSIKITAGSSGSTSCENLNEGIAMATEHLKTTSNRVIINLSFSVCSATFQYINDFTSNGGLFVMAAGNSFIDDCDYFTELNTKSSLLVGATTKYDTLPFFTNYGECVDIYAPGYSILSTSIYGGCRFSSGTSMASPHVAGAAAIYWSYNLEKSNYDIKNIIMDNAIPDALTFSFGKYGNNELLHVNSNDGEIYTIGIFCTSIVLFFVLIV